MKAQVADKTGRKVLRQGYEEAVKVVTTGWPVWAERCGRRATEEVSPANPTARIVQASKRPAQRRKGVGAVTRPLSKPLPSPTRSITGPVRRGRREPHPTAPECVAAPRARHGRPQPTEMALATPRLVDARVGAARPRGRQITPRSFIKPIRQRDAIARRANHKTPSVPV